MSTASQRPAAWDAVDNEALPANIPALLDGAAARHPERVFWNTIEDDGSTLTFPEFARLTRVCAAQLRESGVRKPSLGKLFDRIVEHRIDTCLVTYPVAKLKSDPQGVDPQRFPLPVYALANAKGAQA